MDNPATLGTQCKIQDEDKQKTQHNTEKATRTPPKHWACTTRTTPKHWACTTRTPPKHCMILATVYLQLHVYGPIVNKSHQKKEIIIQT